MWNCFTSTALGKSYARMRSLMMDVLKSCQAPPKNGLPPNRFAALNPINIGNSVNGAFKDVNHIC